MSESSSEDLIGVKLSFHEGNRVPFMREKIYRVDEGNRVPLKVPLLEGQAHPERDGGRRSPEPLCLPRLGCSASREKHPRLAASATWSGSCKSGKAHHTECRLLRTPGNKCQSHRPMILTVLSFLFTKKL